MSQPPTETILIVDDSLTNIRLLSGILAQHNYVLTVAMDGARALEMAFANPPDLILLDINMPVMDGYEVCHRLKANPQTSDIPVIFISALDAVEDKVAAFAAGGVDYVTRPFQTEEIIARVQTHLALRRLYVDMEQRVEERTAELVQANRALQSEIIERRRAEDALRRSEEQFRAFFEQSPVGIGVARGGTTVMVNPAYVRMFGYERGDELAGMPIIQRVAPEDRAAIVERVERRQRGEEVESHYIMTGLRKDGTLFPVLCNVAQVHLLDGKVASIAFFTDMTDQKRAEEAIRSSEATYRAMFEKNRAIQLLIDPETGAIVDANPAACLFYGYSHETLQTMNIIQINTLPLAETMQALQDARAERSLYFEFHHQLQSGDIRAVEVHTSPIEIQGRVLLFSIIHDITQRKQAEAALQQANNQLEQRVHERTLELRTSQMLLQGLLDNSPAAVFLKDRARRYLLVNQHFAQTMGCEPAQMIGKTEDELFPPEWVTAWSEVDQQIIATGKPVSLEPLEMIDGDIRTYWLVKFPLYNAQDEVYAIGGIATDITRLKHVEQTLRERTDELSLANAQMARAVRTKDEFLANMSHELRTPLNAILGLSEALQEEVYGTLTPRQRGSLQSIEESGRHLLNLINDILDLAKIEAGREDLQIGTFPVESVVQASLRLIRPAAHKKRLLITETIDSGVGMIQADERRLKQVLVNLLSNAVKFTPEEGHIGLEVTASVARRTVYFTVWDTGIGIAPDQIERLFEPFTQFDGGLNRQHEGTGLGLSLVLRLTEMHGGSVSVESEVGQGSRFTVALPWHTQEQPGVPACDDVTDGLPQATTTVDRHAGAAMATILVADDNEASLEMLSAYLHASGYRVVVARNGEEAVQRAVAEHPALILMDVQMPRLDGIEATRRIRALDALAKTPIIALTALAMPGDRERCLSAGMNDYMSKPFGLKQVLEVIKTYL